MQKCFQNDAKMDANISVFSYFFEKTEICEFVLPLQRGHDFRGSGHRKMHEQSTQNQHKINARKSFAKSMENDSKMDSKWRPTSLKNLTIHEKRLGENRR